MPLASGKIYANGYQITITFLHPQRYYQAFQLSEKQLECFADLSRPGDVPNTIGAETLLPFAQEPAARTELTYAHVMDPPLRIYKNEYDQPPVSHYPRHRNCVRTPSKDEGTLVSICEALDILKKNEWLDQGRPHSLEALKASMLAEQNNSLSKNDQPSMDINESCLHR